MSLESYAEGDVKEESEGKQDLVWISIAMLILCGKIDLIPAF